MLKQTIRSVRKAYRSISVGWEVFPEPPIIAIPRPVWDNGTDYDIPTYLRRRRDSRRRDRSH